MKGLGKLVKNELIKLSHQTSFRVISIIVLILCIVSPAISIGASKLMLYVGDSLGDPEKSAEQYRDIANEYQGSDPDSVIMNSYYTAYADSYSFFADNGITDWRFSYYSSEHLYYSEIIAGLELIDDGFSPEDVAWVFTYLYQINESEDEDELLFTNVQSTIVSYKSMRAELEQAALKAVVGDIFKNALANLELQVQTLEDLAADAKAAYEASPSSYELKYELDYANASLAAYQSLSDAYKYLRDFVTDYSDWRVTLVFGGLQDAYIALPEYIAVTESAFEDSDELAYTYDSYEIYKSTLSEKYEKQCKAISLMEYSLYHNIPTPQAMQLSPKLTWQSSLTSLMGTVGILLVVLAATSVASEFSQGTIRLLLIRPKKRWKILASKLLALLAVMATYMLSAYVITFCVTLIFGGTTDMISPDLLYIGGSVIELTPFLTTFARMLICAITPLILMLFAFMLSVITRKTALAAAIPLIYSEVLSGVLLTIAYAMSMFFGFVKYTPFLYVNMSSFNTYFLSQFISGSNVSGIIQSIVAGSMSYIESGSLAIGIAYNTAAAVIITVISFAVFTRKEIK